MKLFLDDIREAPPGWFLCMTAQEAIANLKSGEVTHISLDHDLGDEHVCGTGYKVLVWIEEQVATSEFVPPEITIHTSNSSARVKMEAGVKRINQFAKDRK